MEAVAGSSESYSIAFCPSVIAMSNRSGSKSLVSATL